MTPDEKRGALIVAVWMNVLFDIGLAIGVFGPRWLVTAAAVGAFLVAVCLRAGLRRVKR